MRYVNRIHSEVVSKRSQHKNAAAGPMPGGSVGLNRFKLRRSL
jgi:hypothetical protein